MSFFSAFRQLFIYDGFQNPIALSISTNRNLSLAMPAYFGNVATHCSMPNGFVPSPTLTQIMSRSYHIAATDLINVQLLFPNFYNSYLTGETATGGVATIAAAIEYNGVFTQVKFGGLASGSIPNGGILLSDPISAFVPAGKPFFVRTFFQNASGIVNFSNCNLAGTVLGEACNRGTALADQTMGGTVAQAANSVLYTPLAILGITSAPSILVIGDSRTAGIGDTTGAGTSTESGIVTPSLFPTLPFINVATNTEGASDFIAHSNVFRKNLALYCSHVISAHGTIDIQNYAATPAALLASMHAIRAVFAARPFFWATIPPESTSTDGWVTVNNQTTLAGNGNKNTINNAIRNGTTGITNLSGWYELADITESSRDSGLWKAGYTADGIHPNFICNTAIDLSLAINPANLLRY